MLYSLALYDRNNRNNVPYDNVTESIKGKQVSIRQDCLNYINFAKKNPLTDPTALPFSFKPNDPVENLLPFKIRGLLHIYNNSLDLLCYALEVIVKNNGYPSLTHYTRVKILEPLDMKTASIIITEKDTSQLKQLDMAFNRSPAISSVDSSGNLTPASYLCDPKYISDGKSGLTVWCKDYPNDGITRFNSMGLDQYNPGDVFFGTIPMKSSPSDFCKLFKLLIKGGISDKGERILDQSSINWILSPKINSLNNLWTTYPFANDSDNTTWCGGIGKVNSDISNLTTVLSNENIYLWGGAFGTYGLFDLKSGHYLIFGWLISCCLC